MLRLVLSACASRAASCRRIVSLAQRGSASSRPLAAAPPARSFTGTSSSWVRGSSMACTAVYGNIDVQGASELLKGGAKYVDVRTAEEYAAGHAKGAVNVPVMVKQGGAMVANPDFVQQFAAAFPDQSAQLLVGCQSGKRSLVAAQLLTDAGYSDVTNVKGGYLAWTASNLPVEA